MDGRNQLNGLVRRSLVTSVVLAVNAVLGFTGCPRKVLPVDGYLCGIHVLLTLKAMSLTLVGRRDLPGRGFTRISKARNGVIVVSCLLCWKLSVIALVRRGRCRTGRGFIGRIIQRYNGARVGRVP